MTADDEHVPPSYGERTAWTYAVVIPVGTLGYLAVVVPPRALTQPIDQVAWAGPMLWAMGLSIVASIVGAIVFAIVVRDHEGRLDVRDTQIERYGDRVALWFTTAGAIVALPPVDARGRLVLDRQHPVRPRRDRLHLGCDRPDPRPPRDLRWVGRRGSPTPSGCTASRTAR